MKEQITITKVFRLLNPNLNLAKYGLDDFGKEPIGFVAKYIDEQLFAIEMIFSHRSCIDHQINAYVGGKYLMCVDGEIGKEFSDNSLAALLMVNATPEVYLNGESFMEAYKAIATI